jgi:hypothetical protein
MRRLALAAATSLLAFAAPAGAQFYGPLPYLSFADSPFVPGDYDSFYLEDIEDLLVNTPGLAYAGPGVCVAGAGAECFLGGPIDSVGNGGDPKLGHSLWASGYIELTFDEGVLGSLPVAAGLVWTDGTNSITFEAFDEDGLSLGTLIGTHADGSFGGTLGDDRFYGIKYAGGISKLRISNPSGIEIDHIQYGVAGMSAVPEPAGWAMMIGGLVLAGAMIRRRQTHISFG